MPYGTIKVDTITFTDGGVDKSVAISGLVQNPTFTGNVTATGTVSGVTVRATTVSGVTISGTTVNAASGVFTTQISGAVVVAPAGTVGAPSVQVGTGVTVAPGLYGAGTDQLGISVAGSSRLVVDSVGQIRIVTLGSAAAPALVIGNDLNTGLYSLGADQVAISTAGTGRLFVDASGNVGIGTSSPNRLFESSAVTVDNFARINTTGATKSGIEFANGGAVYSQLYFNNVAPYDLSLFQQYSTGSLIFGTNNTERLRIDSSGRLLMGVSSSRFYTSLGDLKLQVEGTSYPNSSIGLTNNQAAVDGAYIALAKTRGTSVGSLTSVQSGDLLGSIWFQGADGTALVRCGAIECVVDGTPGTSDMPGRLVFSTTADGASSPTERMRIDNNGATNVFASNANGVGAISNLAAGATYYLFYGANNGTSTTSGTTCFLVYINGDVRNTNNSYAGISDIKLKENIIDASSQWDDIKALRPVNYNFKSETGAEQHKQLGLIAQEVELVSPGLVTESPDRDAEGNDLGTVTKSVNYSVLYMKAVKALQEAMERIETLEAKVAALESK